MAAVFVEARVAVGGGGGGANCGGGGGVNPDIPFAVVGDLPPEAVSLVAIVPAVAALGFMEGADALCCKGTKSGGGGGGASCGGGGITTADLVFVVVLLCDEAAAAVFVPLPTAATSSGWPFRFSSGGGGHSLGIGFVGDNSLFGEDGIAAAAI